MRMLHFSTNDIEGGAARAAHMLHQSLSHAGVSSRMLVRRKQSNDGTVREIRLLPWYSGGGRLIWRSRFFRRHLLPKPSYTFNLDTAAGIDMRKFNDSTRGDVDAVCLHWITDFLGPESIRALYHHLRCPIFWVLMDIEPLTGGCHYSFGCNGFARRCGRCPQLGSSREKDRSRALWEKKWALLQDLPITFVAPTGWVERRVRESSLYSGHRVFRISLPIDTNLFRPEDQVAARDALGVPKDRKMIFFGCAKLEDPRKGMNHLRDALFALAARLESGGSKVRAEDVLLLVAGESGGNLLDSIPFRRIELGYIREEHRLAMAYQAADLFVCPSVEDAGPLMIPESMLCGTPVVAFDTGGAPDLIRHRETGYLARYADSGDLAQGLFEMLDGRDLRPARSRAREDALRLHHPPGIAERYASLRQELAEGGR